MVNGNGNAKVSDMVVGARQEGRQAGRGDSNYRWAIFHISKRNGFNVFTFALLALMDAQPMDL